MDVTPATPVREEPFAPRQTNTGLFVQMRQRGFSIEDIQAAREAYRLAVRLFSGRYRKTERAFVCHAVGAASAMAEFSTCRRLVTASMLHAAYDSGLFPDGRVGGRTQRHRAWLQREVGAEVEALLHRYQDFPFDAGDPERCLRDGVAVGDEDLLLIALVHELDDLADFGLRFAPKYGASLDTRLQACAVLAEHIGQPSLAGELRVYGELYHDCEWVDDFRSQTLRGFQVTPGLRGYLRQRFNHLRRKPVRLQ